MSNTDQTPTPSLVDVQLAFESWRSTRPGRQSTPEHLRTLAVTLLEQHSLGKVCVALAVNSGALTRWKNSDAVPFVSLPEPEELRTPPAEQNILGTQITLPNGVYIHVPPQVPFLDVITAAHALGVNA